MNDDGFCFFVGEKDSESLVFVFRACLLFSKHRTPGASSVRARRLSHNSDTCFFFFFLPLYPSELPHSPQNLVASLNPAHSHAVVLSWVRPFDGNSPVLYYIVELSENSK